MRAETEIEPTSRWLLYWCGNCARREFWKTVRMCSDPRLFLEDGELRCKRYRCEVMEI